MRKMMMWVMLSLFCALAQGTKAEAGGGIATDLSALNLCLYADCEARGSYAADPFGWPNPGTLGYSLHHVKRGALISGGYFDVQVGDVQADVGNVTTTLAWDPFVFQVSGAYATGGGSIYEDLPAVKLGVDMPVVRLAMAIDLTRYNLDGLSIGLLAAMPGIEEEVKVGVPALGLTAIDSRSERTADITVGMHWAGGEKDWLMLGALVNPQVLEGRAKILDLETGEIESEKATGANLFARVGASVVPAIPLGVVPGTLLADWFGDMRLGFDLEQRVIYAPGEGSSTETIGYFGLDVKLIPDRWNPLSKFIRFYGIVGKDTTPDGYGAGLGVYGNPEGPMSWFSCNGAYSSRPLTNEIGNKVEIGTIGCSAIIPF